MDSSIMKQKLFSASLLYKTLISVCLVFSVSLTTAFAGGLDATTQAKVDKYKKQLADWAQDPAVIAAVEQANKNSNSMSNDSWKALKPQDTKVMSYQESAAGKKLTSWNSDKSLGKLFLRDKKGNLVAGSKKPAIFNIADRPAFSKAMNGKGWNASKVKPDPTTKLSSVQVSYPVISNGANIGVIHTAVIVE